MTQLALTQLEVIAEDLPEHDERMATYQSLGLEYSAAWRLEIHAAKIISLIRRSVVETGAELLAARATADFGTWTPFLQRIGIEERTAQNYMSVARAFGDKPEIVSALHPTALYALAAPTADPSTVEAIITEVAQGARPRVEDIRRRLAGARLPADVAERTDEAGSQPGTIHPLMAPLLVDAEPATRPGTVETPPRPAAPPVSDGHDQQIEPPLEVLATVEAGGKPAEAKDQHSDRARDAAPRPPDTFPPPLVFATPDAHAEEVRLTATAALLSAALEQTHRLLATVSEVDRREIVLPEARIQEAADLFLAAPALRAAASLLALHATTELREGATTEPEPVIG